MSIKDLELLNSNLQHMLAVLSQERAADQACIDRVRPGARINPHMLRPNGQLHLRPRLPIRFHP